MKNSYTFASEPGEFNDRFYLHFKKQSTNEDVNEKQNYFYFAEDKIYGKLLDYANVKINIYNVISQLMATFEIENTTNFVQTVNLPRGIYVMQIIAGTQNYTQKIYID